MSKETRNPYEYCKKHKTISVKTTAGCPFCLQAELADYKEGCKGLKASVRDLRTEAERLKFELRMFEYTQRAVSEIWKILGVETCEQAKDKSVDQLVQDKVDENKRLREGLEEIEAVACGEQQIEADGDYDDGDGMKWIYDRTQALKGECKQNVFMTREERITAFHKSRGEKWSEERKQWIPKGD